VLEALFEKWFPQWKAGFIGSTCADKNYCVACRECTNKWGEISWGEIAHL